MAVITDREGIVPKPASGLSAIDWTALVLMIIGAVNWGLVGAFGIDLVAAIFGEMSALARLVYVLVGLAGLWGIGMAIKLKRY
jgi:uncharacterized membrane protein YuzA (DUF378 family)